MKKRPNQLSFTMVELAVVLAIMIVILTIAVPRLKDLLGGSKLQTAARQVYDALSQARSNAITTHKRTRAFFPVATDDSAGGTYRTQMYKTTGSTTDAYTDLSSYLNQSYIIADYAYDTLAATPGWRWIARTSWNFLPKGTVFDHDTRATALFSGTWGGSDCILLKGGQTAFPVSANATKTPTSQTDVDSTVYFFAGAGGSIIGQSVTFSSAVATTEAAYIDFKPTGASSQNVALKIVEGFYTGTGGSVTYTNVNASGTPCTSIAPCPNNYSLIVADALTGRLRIKKPGGTDGGCQ